MSYLLYMVGPASTNKSVRAKLLFLWETVAWLWLTFSTYLISKRPLWTKTETNSETASVKWSINGTSV
jgi:hypothetical protein